MYGFKSKINKSKDEGKKADFIHEHKSFIRFKCKSPSIVSLNDFRYISTVFIKYISKYGKLSIYNEPITRETVFKELHISVATYIYYFSTLNILFYVT